MEKAIKVCLYDQAREFKRLGLMQRSECFYDPAGRLFQHDFNAHPEADVSAYDLVELLAFFPTSLQYKGKEVLFGGSKESIGAYYTDPATWVEIDETEMEYGIIESIAVTYAALLLGSIQRGLLTVEDCNKNYILSLTRQ